MLNTIILAILNLLLASGQWSSFQKGEILKKIEWMENHPEETKSYFSVKTFLDTFFSDWDDVLDLYPEKQKLYSMLWNTYKQYRKTDLICMFMEYLASRKVSSPMQKHMLKIALQDLKHIPWEEGDKNYYIPFNWVMQSWYSIECQIASQEEQDEYDALVSKLLKFYETSEFKEWKWQNIDRYRKWRGDFDDIPF